MYDGARCKESLSLHNIERRKNGKLAALGVKADIYKYRVDDESDKSVLNLDGEVMTAVLKRKVEGCIKNYKDKGVKDIEIEFFLACHGSSRSKYISIEDRYDDKRKHKVSVEVVADVIADVGKYFKEKYNASLAVKLNICEGATNDSDTINEKKLKSHRKKLSEENTKFSISLQDLGKTHGVLTSNDGGKEYSAEYLHDSTLEKFVNHLKNPEIFKKIKAYNTLISSYTFNIFSNNSSSLHHNRSYDVGAVIVRSEGSNSNEHKR